MAERLTYSILRTTLTALGKEETKARIAEAQRALHRIEALGFFVYLATEEEQQTVKQDEIELPPTRDLGLQPPPDFGVEFKP
jgi:hypothetical protein